MNSRRHRVLLSRQLNFCVGLKLRNPHYSEQLNRQIFGRSYGPHGAEFQLRVFLEGPVSILNGMIVNLVEVKPILAELGGLLADKFIDEDVPFFADQRPTIENIARFLWQNLPATIGEGKLCRLDLAQSTGAKAEILVDCKDMKVSHSYEFAAAHRLFVPSMTEEENWRQFDKCSNRAGHGHNFQLHVWVEGTPDGATGFIINPRVLDAIVDEEVFQRFDHKHLNEDCPEFAQTGLVPTTENLALTICGLLSDRLGREGYKLSKIGVQETQKNYFEVEV